MTQNPPSLGRTTPWALRRGLESLGLLLLALIGCSPAGAISPAPDPQIIGGRGKGDGYFHQPRAIEALGDGSCVVIDRSGRIQHFEGNGSVRNSWRLPEFSEGQPIDLTLTPWNTLLVSDTHYARILEFDLEGRELRRIGETAGLEVVRGIAVDPQGIIFLADYGEQDRVHRFHRDGTHLGTIGSRGDGDGQFLRPEGIAVGERGDLYVVDCGHHRVLRFHPDGTYVSAFGSFGSELGQFLFPMDIAAASDGTLYVVDFQGNRVQRFEADGTPIGAVGGPGHEPGRFATPRGVAVLAKEDGHHVYVADTQNHRVQVFHWPERTR